MIYAKTYIYRTSHIRNLQKGQLQIQMEYGIALCFVGKVKIEN